MPTLKKLLAIGLLLALVLQTAFADVKTTQSPTQVTYLTIQQATAMALEQSTALKQLENAYEDLFAGYRATELGARQLQSLYDKWNDYVVLFDKRVKGQAMTQEENIKYMTYELMFGDRRPNKTGEEIYDEFIEPIEVNMEKMSTQVKNLYEDMITTKLQIQLGAHDLYFNVVKLDANIENLKHYLALQEKAEAIEKVKFEKGTITFETYQAAVLSTFETQNQVSSLVQSRQGALDALKNMCGIEYEANVVLTDTTFKFNALTLEPPQNYKERAITASSAVVKTKRSLDAAQFESDTIAKYYTNPLVLKRWGVDIGLEQAQVNVYSAESDAVKAVNQAYIDAFKAKSALLVNGDALKSSLLQERNAQATFKAGYLTQHQLDMAKYGVTTSRLNYTQSMLDYQLKMFKLESLLTNADQFDKEYLK